MKILGIETSCDETGVALYDSTEGIVAEALYSQITVHNDYGGVVPELASRDHVRKLLPLVKEVIAKADVRPDDIDAVAYTAGPGLLGAVLVGASFARSLAYGWNVPAIAVHHMEGHLLAPMLEPDHPEFPFVALLVSGGHTQLYQVDDFSQYTLLGESLDDAAGEAFDKTAKLLGLDYPGGPLLSALAKKGRPEIYKFPRPMTDRPGLDLSFSGLKTFAANTISKSDGKDQSKADIARAFEEAVVDTLIIKCKRALIQTELKQLVIAGGVSANDKLRDNMSEAMNKIGITVYYPRQAYCTDNGAMIAYAGYRRFLTGQFEPLAIRAKARWPLAELTNNN